MNIHELEQMTGITRQNIRFYEKKGLLHPARNAANNYRQYTQEDVETLRVIRILRRLDMPIEEIYGVLAQEILLEDALQRHLQILTEKKKELESGISVCRKLAHTSLAELDADRVLREMEEMEKEGGIFMSIINDYRQVKREDGLKTFSFIPDTMVRSPQEFTDALLAYARENDLDLTITQESMNPVFEIDQVEYTASRTFGRFGAEVHCSMTHPELVEDGNVSERKRKIFRFISRYMVVFFLIVFLVVTRGSIKSAAIVSIAILPPLVWTFGLTGRFKGR